MLGVIDLADPNAETAAVVADRIRAALKFLPPDRLVPAPDCQRLSQRQHAKLHAK